MKKIAIRLRIHPPKRRNPQQRLKARLYYRQNRAKIRMQRRRYLRIHKSVIKHRKMFMRFKPTWFKKPKKIHKPKKIKISIPKFHHPKPFHMNKPKVHRPKSIFKKHLP
jgi:hypothetical protein